MNSIHTRAIFLLVSGGVLGALSIQKIQQAQKPGPVRTLAESSPEADLLRAQARLKTQYDIDFKAQGISVGFFPQNPENAKVGACKIYPQRGHKEVLVDRTFWNESSTCIKMAVLIHEYAHCAFRLPHNPDPESVMHEEVPRDECSEAPEGALRAYVDEIFQRVGKKFAGRT